MFYAKYNLLQDPSFCVPPPLAMARLRTHFPKNQTSNQDTISYAVSAIGAQ